MRSSLFHSEEESADILSDYRMTWLTFRVPASCCCQCDRKTDCHIAWSLYPLASPDIHIILCGWWAYTSQINSWSHKFQKRLVRIDWTWSFLLCNWRTNEPAALVHLSSQLIQQQQCDKLHFFREFTKVLGGDYVSPWIPFTRLPATSHYSNAH